MRHAKSSWDNPGLTDSERPLNKRGKKNAPFMGKLLKKMNEIPELIISSPAVRAYKTAKKAAKKIDYPSDKIVKDEKLYMAGTNDFLSVIGNTKPVIDKLMLVSHHPGIAQFANFIAGTNIENIPTAGIVRIDFDTNSWDEIPRMKGRLIFFEYPKKYKDRVGI